MVLVIGFVFTPLIARTVRSAVLVESELDYVAAARLRGDGALAIMFVEILPNVLPIAVVEMTVRLGYAIFFVASLSLLGFGIQPPSADWGIAIAENYSLIGSYWWTVLFDAARHGFTGDRRQSGRRRTRERVRGMSEIRPTRCASSISRSSFGSASASAKWCRDVSFAIRRGESYGLVGESGCGKSTVAFAAIRYLARNGRVSGGRIRVDGRDLARCRRGSCAACARTAIAMVYQDPGRALNPSMRIGTPDGGGVRGRGGLPGRAALERAARDAGARADRESRARAAKLSSRAVGRHAAAGGHRHGAVDRTLRC